MKTFLLSFFFLSLSLTSFGENTRFVAFGDTFYKSSSYSRFPQFKEKINVKNPQFIVHVGDFRGGSYKKNGCFQNQVFDKVFNLFKSFSQPLFYTPGDNDWTDCTGAYGSLSKHQALTFLRKYFFNTNFLKNGLQTFQAHSQTPFLENKIWHHEQVLFATLHIVGTNNNFAEQQEFKSRNQANLTWLRKTFQEALNSSKKAIVIFSHVSPLTNKTGTANLTTLLNTLLNENPQFNKNILLVNGDDHRYYFKKGSINQLTVPQHLSGVIVNINTSTTPVHFDIQRF